MLWSRKETPMFLEKLSDWLDSPVFKTEKPARIALVIFQLAVMLLFLSIIVSIIVKLINRASG